MFMTIVLLQDRDDMKVKDGYITCGEDEYYFEEGLTLVDETHREGWCNIGDDVYTLKIEYHNDDGDEYETINLLKNGEDTLVEGYEDEGDDYELEYRKATFMADIDGKPTIIIHYDKQMDKILNALIDDEYMNLHESIKEIDRELHYTKTTFTKTMDNDHYKLIINECYNTEEKIETFIHRLFKNGNVMQKGTHRCYTRADGISYAHH
jgi:hypothetical protein